MLPYIKFKYSEKATKNEKKISHFVLTLVGNFEERWEIFFKFCGLLTISELYYIEADYTPATKRGLLKKTFVKLVVK